MTAQEQLARQQLIDALRVLAKPGETLTVQVDGRELTIREELEPSVYEGQVMLQPWFDSPDTGCVTVMAKRGALPPTDPIDVPPHDEELE
jgi:hypothetical protein